MHYLKRRIPRPSKQAVSVEDQVKEILARVREEGDSAVRKFTQKFDGVELEHLRTGAAALKNAYKLVSRETIDSLTFAKDQITYFAEQQLACLKTLECSNLPGMTLGHKLLPVSSVGAYVPAGRYPLPSTALMSVIPAKVAGVKKVAVCSPPSKQYGTIHPAVLVAMDMAGADEIYCMGGAQAIGAFTYGTDSVPGVDIIVGPGNMYVTEAKRQVIGRVGIDLLAGPSEVLIIADDTADAKLAAIDLLAKCEHDPMSIAILVTTSKKLGEQVLKEIETELTEIGTARTAAATWNENGEISVVDNIDDAIGLANEIASEHVQLMTSSNEKIMAEIINFGSLFVGQYAPVAFGDYVSGPNHTLPTLTGARYANGLWVGTFIKVASYQVVTREGASILAGPCSYLAGVEGLFAHQRSANLRK
ncbi:MAG: histidinol dehydrogenase [Bacillota bacterium]